MKLQIAVIVTLLVPMPVNAHHRVVRQSCSAYQYTETYKPGYYLPNGIWVSGRVAESQIEIPCNTQGHQTAHYQTPPQHHHSSQYPVQYQSPTNTNNSIPASNQCDQLARMGLTAGGGAILGRYLGGGVKSKHTIRNTTIGAIAGGIVGRIIPC